MASYSISSFYSLEVIISNSTDTQKEGYIFRNHRFITTLIIFFLARNRYKLYFNTGYTISLIDRQFLHKIHPKIEIKKMPLPIIVRGLGTTTYNTSEYIRLKFYLPGENSTALIKREFYLINNLTTKALIRINIIKSKGIILDVVRNIITITLYKDIRVPITSASHY